MTGKKREIQRVPRCVFCGRDSGVQFAIFNPRFPPFGTACVECEAKLPPGTVAIVNAPAPAKEPMP
jgi:hypothetical protein